MASNVMGLIGGNGMDRCPHTTLRAASRLRVLSHQLAVHPAHEHVGHEHESAEAAGATTGTTTPCTPCWCTPWPARRARAARCAASSSSSASLHAGWSSARRQVHVSMHTPTIGAVITGVDLARPTGEAAEACSIHEALTVHGVLFFRGQVRWIPTRHTDTRHVPLLRSSVQPLNLQPGHKCF